MRVLVADASATMRSLLRNAMRRLAGAEVTMASSLAEASEACEAPFDLVVIDRDLTPGPDWGWLGTLRERACPSGRLIVIGTRVSRAEAMAIRELGAGAFVLEPIDPERLRERAEALLAEATDSATAAETVSEDDEAQAEAA